MVVIVVGYIDSLGLMLRFMVDAVTIVVVVGVWVEPQQVVLVVGHGMMGKNR